MSKDVKGGWALVTGASGGLGADFAIALAERGVNLILAARRAEPMQALAIKLKENHGIEVFVETIDLSSPGSGLELHGAVARRGVKLDILVNNAGKGLYGDFVEQPLSRALEMVQLNICSVMELTHLFAEDMVKRGAGHILLVASLTAYQPVPSYAAYAASKAFVLSFGEAMHAELEKHGVTLTVLSPGLMETGFLDVAGQSPTASVKRMMMKPRSVVDIGMRALFSGRSSVIAGTMNKIMAFSNRLTTRRMQANVAYKMMKS